MATKDPQKAREMIGAAMMRLHNNQPMLPAVREYFIEVFGEILSGTSADEAFGFKGKGQGNKSASENLTQRRDWAVCNRIKEYLRAKKLTKANEAAYRYAANKNYVDPRGDGIKRRTYGKDRIQTIWEEYNPPR